MRVACYRIPDLPLAAQLRAQPELAGHPLVVVAGRGPRTGLVAVSPEAARAGVRRSGSLAHARAVCGALCVRLCSPALEGAARAALLDAALSLSPRAALAPPAAGAYAAEAAVYLDASGMRSLFHSEHGFATALASRGERLGLPGCVAVASSQRLAHVAARTLATGDPPCLLAAGDEAEFLAGLPVDLLDPPDPLAETLTRFGVRRVRDLLALPRRALAARLGSAALELAALARGEGREAPRSAPAAGRSSEAGDFESGIDRLEPLACALQALLSRLLERLALRHLACGDLHLTLELEGGGRDAWRVGVAAPTRALPVLLRLIRHALEARPPRAPVCGACLETEGRALPSDQLDLFRPPGPAPAALDRTLAELASRCGDRRIGAPQVADDHHPEAFAVVPFRSRGRAEPPEEPPSGAPGPRPAALRGPALRALRPPIPASVQLLRGRPEVVRSAVANGRVTRLAGPWRTTGAWWSPELRFAYDSFDVRTSDGTVARLRFDHVRKTWHVDAVYD